MSDLSVVGGGECTGMAGGICGFEDVVAELSLSDWGKLDGFGGGGIVGVGDGARDSEFSGG